MKLGLFMVASLAIPASAQIAHGVRMPPEIGVAYGRLGRAMMTHDIAEVREVWAEDFVVKSPNNEVLGREQVIAALEKDLLDYRDFHKHITFVTAKPEVTIVMGYDTMVSLRVPARASG